MEIMTQAISDSYEGGVWVALEYLVPLITLAVLFSLSIHFVKKLLGSIATGGGKNPLGGPAGLNMSQKDYDRWGS